MSKHITTKTRYINIATYIKTLDEKAKLKLKLYLNFKYKTDKFQLLFIAESEINKIINSI